MQKDRSHWTVRKVSLAEAERLDDEYYASLTMEERLVMLMELRDCFSDEHNHRMVPVVRKYRLGDQHD